MCADHASECWRAGAQVPRRRQLARAAAILAEAGSPAFSPGGGAGRGRRTGGDRRAARRHLLRRRCWESGASRTTAPMHGRGRPARDAALAGSAAVLRYVTYRRQQLPVYRVYPQARPAPAPCRSTGTARGSGFAIPSNAAWWAMPRRCLARLLRAAPADTRTARFWKRHRRHARTGARALKEQGERRETPMKPQVVGDELNKLLANDAIVTTDSGTNTSWAARYLDMREGMMFSCSGTLATMACGLPYAMAAALAFPGAAGRRFRRRRRAHHADRRARDLREIRAEREDRGDQEQQPRPDQMGADRVPGQSGIWLRPAAHRLRRGRARLAGSPAMPSRIPAQCGAILREALATPGPALIEAMVDPNEPPMPPKATFEQTKNLVEALARGTPDAGQIARNIALGQILRIDLNPRYWLGCPSPRPRLSRQPSTRERSAGRYVKIRPRLAELRGRPAGPPVQSGRGRRKATPQNSCLGTVMVLKQRPSV